MVRIVSLLLLLSTMLMSTGSAEILEIPLPDLVGCYSVEISHTAAFDLGMSLDSIRGAWISWSGTITPGLGHGDGVELPWDDWFPWPSQLSAGMDPDNDGLWLASVGPVDGPFADTTEFEGFLGPTWDFLLDGVGEVEVRIAPLYIIGGIMVESPEATVDQAALILDAVAAPLPTFIRGDDDGDGTLTISDPILSLCAQFASCTLSCADASDVDDDGEITISDAIYNLAAQFIEHPPPPPPFPDCGSDPTPDTLDCPCHVYCQGCGGPPLHVSNLVTDDRVPAKAEPTVNPIGETRALPTLANNGNRVVESTSPLQLKACPNPANGYTTLRYSVPVGGPARIAVYNSAGQVVRDLLGGSVLTGEHDVIWDGTNDFGVKVPPGVYFCSVTNGAGGQICKIVLTR